MPTSHGASAAGRRRAAEFRNATPLADRRSGYEPDYSVRRNLINRLLSGALWAEQIRRSATSAPRRTSRYRTEAGPRSPEHRDLRLQGSADVLRQVRAARARPSRFTSERSRSTSGSFGPRATRPRGTTSRSARCSAAIGQFDNSRSEINARKAAWESRRVASGGRCFTPAASAPALAFEQGVPAESVACSRSSLSELGRTNVREPDSPVLVPTLRGSSPASISSSGATVTRRRFLRRIDTLVGKESAGANSRPI